MSEGPIALSEDPTDKRPAVFRTIAATLLRDALSTGNLRRDEVAGIKLHVSNSLANIEELVLAEVDKLLPYVEIHVEVDSWRLQEAEERAEREARYGAQPGEAGAVW
jgi:hypothetical protein